jgi:hypothetical protein
MSLHSSAPPLEVSKKDYSKKRVEINNSIRHSDENGAIIFIASHRNHRIAAIDKTGSMDRRQI